MVTPRFVKSRVSKCDMTFQVDELAFEPTQPIYHYLGVRNLTSPLMSTLAFDVK